MGIMANGVKQWVFQRVSNALIVTFGLVLFSILLSADELSYQSLKDLFSGGFKFYFVLVLILACINSVLAGWQIDGDYAKKFGLPTMAITVITIVVSLGYLFYGLKLLFS